MLSSKAGEGIQVSGGHAGERRRKAHSILRVWRFHDRLSTPVRAEQGDHANRNRGRGRRERHLPGEHGRPGRVEETDT